MKNHPSPIPHIKSITDFFTSYGIGRPIHPDIMCMRLEDQPDDRLMYMPLYRANFYRVIHFINSDILSLVHDKRQEITKNCLVFSFPGKVKQQSTVIGCNTNTMLKRSDFGVGGKLATIMVADEISIRATRRVSKEIGII